MRILLKYIITYQIYKYIKHWKNKTNFYLNLTFLKKKLNTRKDINLHKYLRYTNINTLMLTLILTHNIYEDILF